MPLIDTADILRDAHLNNYGVGSFNVYNLETTQAVIKAAELEKSPVMIQAWAGIFDPGQVTMKTLVALVKARASQSAVPVSLHLDHAESFAVICRAVRAGFTSVMIDASELEFRNNIALTKKVVEMAHAAGVTVEAELGHVGEEEEENILTDPDEAAVFAEETDVDYLAVSIGSIHGYNEERVKLDISRLREIGNRVDIPLVLHGSSYLPAAEMKKAVKNGISKVNINTEVSLAMIDGIRIALEENPDNIYASVLTDGGRDKMIEVIRGRINILDSTGRMIG